jgi:hypothetical protein
MLIAPAMAEARATPFPIMFIASPRPVTPPPSSIFTPIIAAAIPLVTTEAGPGIAATIVAAADAISIPVDALIA